MTTSLIKLGTLLIVFLLSKSSSKNNAVKSEKEDIEDFDEYFYGMSEQNLISVPGEVPGHPPSIVPVIPAGSGAILSCSGPIALVTQCAWQSPGQSCCYGDGCEEDQRGCGGGRGFQVIRNVEEGMATCQLVLKSVTEEDDGGEDGDMWTCHLGYEEGVFFHYFIVPCPGIVKWTENVKAEDDFAGVRMVLATEGEVPDIGVSCEEYKICGRD